MPEGFWNEERVTTLRQLADKNCSASIIAQEIGATRNQVIGKAHRLKIALNGYEGTTARSATKVSTAAVRRARKPASKRPAAARKPPKAITKPARYLPIPVQIAPPVSRNGVSITDLKVNECRFPLGNAKDPVRFFCGVPTKNEKCSYCLYHMAVAYIPGSARTPGAPRDHHNIRRRYAEAAE